MTIVLKSIKTIPVISRSGSVNLTELLGERPAVVDQGFEVFLSRAGEEFNTEAMVLDASRIIKIESTEDLPRINGSNVHEICGILSVLREHDLLIIQNGEEEVEVVLGLANFAGRDFVLLVEHENNHGGSQIHCHARPVEDWKNDGSILVTKINGFGM